MDWQCLKFEQLSTIQLYELIKLRVDVFVVEQNCPYPELDNKDIQDGVYHFLGYKENTLVACARLLPQGLSFKTVSIGRVATNALYRGDGLGHELMANAVKQCHIIWKNPDITIGAQAHLEKFYAQHGFVKVSEIYLEDDIPHINMWRSSTTLTN